MRLRCSAVVAQNAFHTVSAMAEFEELIKINLISESARTQPSRPVGSVSRPGVFRSCVTSVHQPLVGVPRLAWNTARSAPSGTVQPVLP